MTAAGFELFDHTADIGLRVWGRTPEDLILPAAEGLYAVIGELQPAETAGDMTLDFSGGDQAELLRDFLDELLVMFDRDHLMAREVRALQFDDRRLQVQLTWHSVDRRRSRYHREVKAVTYHDLALRQTPEGCEVRLILDI